MTSRYIWTASHGSAQTSFILNLWTFASENGMHACFLPLCFKEIIWMVIRSYYYWQKPASGLGISRYASYHQHLFLMLKSIWGRFFPICWTPDLLEEVSIDRLYSKMLCLYQVRKKKAWNMKLWISSSWKHDSTDTYCSWQP